MGRSEKHSHLWRTISFSPDPTHPFVLRGCVGARHCIETTLVCLLCERDGRKRSHAKHNPVTDDAMHDDAAFLLAAAAHDRERTFFTRRGSVVLD